MRIRSIRPEFWSSEDIAAMDWHTRLVYIGLWSYVDDNGVGRDIERLIVTDLFPLDDDLRESSRRVTGALRHLSERNHITRYVVDGKRFLHIVKWSTHQRIEKASKGRYPLPTCGNAEITEPSPTTTGALPDMSAPGEGEKGRRGEGEKSSSSDAAASDPDRFEEFWTAYGYKLKRADAVKAWAKAIRKAEPDLIIARAAEYVARIAADRSARGDRATSQAHAASWLNGERWNDEHDSNNVHQLRPQDEGGWFQPFYMPAAPSEVEDDPEAYEAWAEGRRAAWRAGERW